MYSKNFARFENISPQKLETSRLKSNVDSGVKTNIPIRSYSDNSAIEVFNKLGESDSRNDTSETNITEIGSKEDESIVNNAQKDIEINEKDIKPKEHSIFKDFHKLTEIIDDDWFLIILAISIFIFGRNETNDKLTPIALLAIMFL